MNLWLVALITLAATGASGLIHPHLPRWVRGRRLIATVIGVMVTLGLLYLIIRSASQ